MKRTTYIPYKRSTRHSATFPNAATAADRYHRLVDYMLTGAAALGMVTAVLFLVTL